MENVQKCHLRSRRWRHSLQQAQDVSRAPSAHIFIILSPCVSAQTGLSKRPTTDPSQTPHLGFAEAFVCLIHYCPRAAVQWKGQWSYVRVLVPH